MKSVPKKQLVQAEPELEAAEFWKLRLYVAGQTPKSLMALANLKRLCEERLKDRYTIEVVDLIEHPRQAKDDQIFAIPTLVRRLPAPMRRILGDLSNTERVLVGMDLVSQSGREPTKAS